MRSSKKEQKLIKSDDMDNNKVKTRGKKRKRKASENSDVDDDLPENASEVEKNLQASAISNNSDEISVKKRPKKVNLKSKKSVKLKEKEEEKEATTENENCFRKLTRSKVKELKKVSPETKSWNFDNLELTPINHIPVRTRPEVKALIAQELPEDDDDEEYQPTQDDIMSDDDQTLETCSDIDSLPRTPGTELITSHPSSPKVIKDGPFVLPQESNNKKQNEDKEEEEATIALRTRSKLSLSETSIEHIENSFVPPDDAPMHECDNLWTDFLMDCLNPAPTFNDDDDEADPEYNVAADPDAVEDDEDGLDPSIVRISKKELNDLVTELFKIMPEDDNFNRVLNEIQEEPSYSKQWEGKREPVSDEDANANTTAIDAKRKSDFHYVGKVEPGNMDDAKTETIQVQNDSVNTVGENSTQENESNKSISNNNSDKVSGPTVMNINIVESSHSVKSPPRAETNVPPILLKLRQDTVTEDVIQVEIDETVQILHEQKLILEQQIRQHVQIATSSFLQIYAHPRYWNMAPTYKNYLETFMNMKAKNPQSIVNVCNLQLAWDLITSWETSMSENTPENIAMVKFVQEQMERNQRRTVQNCLYAGEFHDTFKQVIANSTVFLYPHLLPPMPFRNEPRMKFGYKRCEDKLIALGLEQFWNYVESNPKIYKRPMRRTNIRWGVLRSVELLCKYMFTWLTPKALMSHIHNARKTDPDNPITKFFNNGEITPVQHKLYPFNPDITLYQQPEHEVPRLWIRYLAKNSRRFRDCLYRRKTYLGHVEGVPVDVRIPGGVPKKNPLAITYTEKESQPVMLLSQRPAQEEESLIVNNVKMVAKKGFIEIDQSLNVTNGGIATVEIVGISDNNNTTCLETPLVSSVEDPNLVCNNKSVQKSKKRTRERGITGDDVPMSLDHCDCCVLIRQISKIKQKTITDYFGSKAAKTKTCPCKTITEYPKVSKRLKILINLYKSRSKMLITDLKRKLVTWRRHEDFDVETEDSSCDFHDLAYVLSYHTRLSILTGVTRPHYFKKQLHTFFSRFEPDRDDPIELSHKLFKVLGVEMFDMYREFIGFLTPNQAEELGRYKDYFVLNCLPEFVSKVEEQISDRYMRYRILACLTAILKDIPVTSSACQICSEILPILTDHPKLAEHVFSLFPHILSDSEQQNTGSEEIETKTSHETVELENRTKSACEEIEVENKTTTECETMEAGSSTKSVCETIKVGNVTESPSETIEVGSSTKSACVEMKVEDKTNTDCERMDVGNSSESACETIEVGNSIKSVYGNVKVEENKENINSDNKEAIIPVFYDTDETYYDSDADNFKMKYFSENQIKEENNEKIDIHKMIINGKNECPMSMEYEADDSSSNEESVDPASSITIDEITIKEEIEDDSAENRMVNENDCMESYESEMPILMMSEDEMKIESPEWTRNEDKLILTILKESLTSAEYETKSLLDLVKDENIVEMISAGLNNKSNDDIKNRMLYLLELWLLNS